MDKLLLFPGKSEKGIFTFLVDQEHDFLLKTASEFHPEIAAYVHHAKPIPGKTQILLTALGAGEWWGCNVNGDYFPEQSLAFPGDDFGYRTFQIHAKVYKHHINKDPTANYGEVTLAVYNQKYHRVELIVALDNTKAADIVANINAGDYPEWSMGCRVPYDVCSICGNKAPTRAQYCEHLRYYIGRIHPETGKMAYAINTHPKFFDISQVLIGADKIAKTLKKVASAGAAQVMSSAFIAEKMAVADKEAEIEKEVPASEPPASQEAMDTLVRAIPEVKAREMALPRETLDSLGSMPLKDVFSTLPLLGLLPKPQEFQRIVLVNIGKKDLADQLDNQGMCFDPSWVEDPASSHMKLVSMDGAPNTDIISMLRPHLAERSYFPQFLGPRMVVMIKRAEHEAQNLPTFIPNEERKPLGIIPLLMLAAGMYAAFSKKAPEKAVGSLDKAMANHPLLAAALASSIPITFNHMVGEHTKGYEPELQQDRYDLFARIEEQKAKPYMKVAGVTSALAGNPAFKRLALGIPAVYMASGVLQKHREANPYEQEGRIKSFVRRNPDILGAALAADALMALQGKGSTKVLRGLSSAGKGFWDKAREYASDVMKQPSLKTASAQDFLTNALIWPVAFGRTNLPGRVVGGLFDQAVLETSKKVLSNNKPATKLENTDRR